MTSIRPRSIRLLLLPLALLGAACSSSANPGATNETDAGTGNGGSADDAGLVPTVPDADVDAPSDAPDAAPAPAYLRLTHLSPDAPALDFCVALEGGTFVGPMLGTAAGVSYGAATAYYPVASGFYYDVRLVAAGANDCETFVGTYAQSLSTLVAGSYTTLALAGDLSVVGNDASFAGTVCTDVPTVSGAGVALRFINASSNFGQVDFGTGSLAASTFSPLVTGTPFTGSGSAASPDAGSMGVNGYVEVATPAAQIMSAHATNGATDAVVAPSVTVTKGSAVTVFLIGGSSGDAAHPNQLFLCNDGAGAMGMAASCTVLEK